VTDERWGVIGLARPRSAWFRDLTAWANAGLVPVDFLKCIGAAEVRARLASGTPCSALVADADAPGLDRDLVASVHAQGGAVILVTGDLARAGLGIGADATLAPPLEPARLVEALRAHAPTLRGPVTDSGHAVEPHLDEAQDPEWGPGWTGRLVTVIGGPGAGTSTVAMALAQGLADGRGVGGVALADLAIGGHLAMYHDAGDVVPGLQELTEAHRRSVPTRAAVRDHLFAVDARGYDLLLGLRRPRDWTALRRRALEATLRSLVSAYRQVVVDVDADLDGEEATGSADLEDRNARGRLAVRRADLVVVVVDAGLKGLHDGGRVLRDVAPMLERADRLLPVVTRAPKSRRQRAELAAALAELATHPAMPASPVFVERSRQLEELHRLGAALPRSLEVPVTAAVRSMLGRLPAMADTSAVDPERAAVVRR